jgi:hypothetical protein
MGYSERDEFYDQQYAEKIHELSKNVKDDNLRDQTFDEIAKLKYKPSDDPERDAELNFTKAQLAAKESAQFDPNAELYLRFRARETGKSLSSAQAWARKAFINADEE